MATRNSIQKRNISFVLFVMIGFPLLFGATPANAQDISWSTGDGWFFNANNWSPVGAPQNSDIIRIGNLPAAAGSTVLMGAHPGLAYEELYLSNGVTLDTNGSELISFGDAWITGFGTRLIARPAPFLNESDFQGVLHLGQGAHLELRDDVRVTLFPPSESAGTISGRGRLITNAFNNNGIIRPGNNGGLILDAGAIVHNLTVDLDGSLGTGSLQLDTQFSQLQVNAGSLADSFSSSIVMVPGALLEMNIAGGWTADSNSFINVAGSNNPAAASQISGTALAFGGQMNIGGAQGHLRVLAPVTIQNSATVNVGATDWLELDGTTVVQGGQFALGQGAKLQFDGPTTIQGGVFNTISDNIGDGFVAFNGPTTWNGNVTLNGASRQNGNATVSGGLGAVINADRFDMDGGFGNTNWNVNGNLVVNADHIGTSGTNRFGGTINVAGGFLPKLTLNLTDPAASWVMGGTMNLNDITNLYVSRIAGSHMIVEGDLNVSGGRVRIDANTTFSNSGIGGGANVQIGQADSMLRMSGITTVHSNVSFAGMGTFQNALSGDMNLMDGVSLGSVSLDNQGELEIDEKAGIASVHRFENTGTWQVDIGGLLAGTEHDLLIVGGGEAFLGGMLDVDLIDAGSGYFMPEIGDQFTILASLGGVNGTFLNDPTSFLDGHFYQWSVLYNSHDVRLQLASISVPEPSSLVLLLAASVCIVGRRKRSNSSH